MTDEEMQAKYDALKPGVADAVELLFELTELMQELSTIDITEGLELAMADGHDMTLIALHMATMAVNDAKEKKETTPQGN